MLFSKIVTKAFGFPRLNVPLGTGGLFLFLIANSISYFAVGQSKRFGSAC